MTDIKPGGAKKNIDRAIALAEAALRECDEHGFVYAAIDISMAIDKLNEIRRANGE